MKHLLKETTKLTDIAKTIFGDIVNKVYLAEYYSPLLQTEEVTIEIIDKCLKTSESESSDNELSVDNINIVIEFKNGNKVSFNNSEWGSISSYSEDAKIIG